MVGVGGGKGGRLEGERRGRKAKMVEGKRIGEEAEHLEEYGRRMEKGREGWVVGVGGG